MKICREAETRAPQLPQRRDLEAVEAQLRVLAERRARVAELLHTTCEETHVRSAASYTDGEIVDTADGPAPGEAAAESLDLAEPVVVPSGHSVPFSGSCSHPKAPQFR